MSDDARPDRFREPGLDADTEVDRLWERLHALAGRYEALAAERDRLRERADLLEEDLAHVALALAGAVPEPPVNTTAAESAYDMVRALVAERTHLRTVVDAAELLVAALDAGVIRDEASNLRDALQALGAEGWT